MEGMDGDARNDDETGACVDTLRGGHGFRVQGGPQRRSWKLLPHLLPASIDPISYATRPPLLPLLSDGIHSGTGVLGSPLFPIYGNCTTDFDAPHVFSLALGFSTRPPSHVPLPHSRRIRNNGFKTY